MRIDQITPVLEYGDNISSIVFNLDRLIKTMGWEANIYTEAKDEEIERRTLGLNFSEKEKDRVIYHMFTGSDTAKIVLDLKAKTKIMYYHYIIQPEYFDEYIANIYHSKGREQLRLLKDHTDLVITNSKYNEQDLKKMGYECIMVLPPLINLWDYNQEPDPDLVRTYKDGCTNILFVGDISPNNRQEDIIKTFNYYHKRINMKSRLFLVGDFIKHMGYYHKLRDLINELQISNVFITGRVSFGQLLAYYKSANVFVSMSELDGSCTTFIEAMYLDVPVIAYDSGAAGEVLGGAGKLIGDRDVAETARLIDLLVSDKKQRNEILKRQAERVLVDYHPDKVFSAYKKVLNSI